MPSPELDARDRAALVQIGRGSIAHGLRGDGQPFRIANELLSEPLRAPGAAFVTLRRNGDLRGCIGELAPVRPLFESVARNAWAAAFRDPRFRPLAPAEFGEVELHISRIGPHEPIDAASEAALLAVLRPGVDGLVLDDGSHRATFLPAVWESLPAPGDFVQALLRKAGLPANVWPATMRAWRYGVDEIS